MQYSEYLDKTADPSTMIWITMFPRELWHFLLETYPATVNYSTIKNISKAPEKSWWFDVLHPFQNYLNHIETMEGW